MTAHRWPPDYNNGNSETIILGPHKALVWALLMAAILVLLISIAALAYFCWILPKRRKHDGCHWTRPPINIVEEPPQPQPQTSQNGPRNCTLIQTMNGTINPQYSPALPRRPFSEYAEPITLIERPMYASSGALDDINTLPYDEVDMDLRTRSLPAWGRPKQRPQSTTDDIEELYAKVNFSKKKRNRMCNDEAAVIAMSRSRSQCLASGIVNPLPSQLADGDAVVVYNERTAL